MSSRYDYGKGSSRSTRDDSRQERHGRERVRSRSPRERSPRRRHSPTSSRYSKDRPYDKEDRQRSYDKEDKQSSKLKHTEWDDSDEEVPAPPPPPRITKISIPIAKPKAPIKMSIGGPSKRAPAAKPTIASVFNADDDDDEPEEMPAEARMRMRNIGRETPTSAGPNSFGKTKQGFCDAKKVFEKNLKHALETNVEKPVMTKFPQTIYKIKP